MYILSEAPRDMVGLCRENKREHSAGCESSKIFSKKVLTFGLRFGIMAKPSQERAQRNSEWGAEKWLNEAVCWQSDGVNLDKLNNDEKEPDLIKLSLTDSEF